MITDWLLEFKTSHSYWYDPNPLKKHALLSSGKHSNGYINLREFTKQKPSMARVLFQDFYRTYKEVLNLLLEEPGIDYIHGPAMGGVLLANEIAIQTSTGYIYTEKVETIESDIKSVQMVCNFDGLEGKKILLVEDVLTTGNTNAKSVKALVEKGALIVGPLCSLVNRSGTRTLHNQEVCSLLNVFFESHEERECPWCKLGSVAVKPKLLWEDFSS